MSTSPGTTGIARHTIIYGLGTLLHKGIAFLMLPVYTRMLTPADYGVVALIDMTLDVVSIGAGAQLAYAIFRFYHKADTEADQRAVVSTVLLSLLATYALTAGTVALAAEPISRLLFGHPDRAGLIRIAAGGLFAQCLLIVPFAYLRVLEKSPVVASVNLAKLVFQLGMNILFLVMLRFGVEGILMSTAIANLIVGGGLTLWTIRRAGVAFSAPALRALVRYAAPMIATQFATFLATFGDRYFLKAYGTEADVGLYNLSYQFGFLLFGIGFEPFNGMWGPRRFAIARSPDVAERDRALSLGFGYANLLILATATAIGVFVGDVLHVMTTPPFFAAARAVPIILVAYVLLAWCNIQDLGILMRERTEYLTIANWVATAVALAGWFVLVPRFGAMGAAAAGTAAFCMRYALTYRYAQRLWPVRYDWGPTLRMCAASAALVGLAAVLPPLPLVSSIPLHAAMLAAFGVVAWTVGPLTAETKADVLARAQRLLGRRPAAA